jgi:hypothetical protein
VSTTLNDKARYTAVKYAVGVGSAVNVVNKVAHRPWGLPVEQLHAEIACIGIEAGNGSGMAQARQK